MSTVFIVNAAPGAGKSTLLNRLEKELPNGCLVIDADDIAGTAAFLKNPDRQTALRDALVNKCITHRGYGYDVFIIGYVFQVKERLEILSENLKTKGFRVINIMLECEGYELISRLLSRSDERETDITKALEFNRKIRLLDADFKLDITKLNPREVTAKVLEYVCERVNDETD